MSAEIKKEKICKARKTSYTSYCKSTEKETHDEIPHYKETTKPSITLLTTQIRLHTMQIQPFNKHFACMCWSMDCYDANLGGQGTQQTFVGLQDVFKES